MAAERVADGVEVLRLRGPGRLQKLTNVYLLEDEGRVTLFDSGSVQMADAVRRAADERGGIGRVVLSHSHVDHRGGASKLEAPVVCHPDEVADVEGDAGRHYFRFDRVRNPIVRAMAPNMADRMDGGPLKVDDTVAEGGSVAGFEVIHLPGHAPGQIGLWRQSDRLAIVADAVFVFDPFTMSARPGRARLAPAANLPDPEAARASVRKISELDPAAVWLGHYGPLTGDVRTQLDAAAESD
jgi:glyoxylase-like metal-dependent hydrolase (beta-lactamase superfamily II)